VRENVFSKLGDAHEDSGPEGTAPSTSADGGIPSAPVPSLDGDPAPAEQAKAPEKPAEKAEAAAKPSAPAVAQAAPAPKSSPPESAPEPRALASEPPAPLAAVPPLEPPVDAEAPKPETKDHGPKPAAAGERANPWPDAPGSAPAAAVPPRPYERDQTVAPAAVPSLSPAGDWSTLRRRMHELGVARYGFEGEPNGRVRFHCVIPLAGRRAVGQQFEADGDDEFQAAQTALRRVALWQATENK
jgi:hypothetical protein